RAERLWTCPLFIQVTFVGISVKIVNYYGKDLQTPCSTSADPLGVVDPQLKTPVIEHIQCKQHGQDRIRFQRELGDQKPVTMFFQTVFLVLILISVPTADKGAMSQPGRTRLVPEKKERKDGAG
ncbi:hypothetical protein GBF38_010624, partial [Nibea albiflora]